MNMIVFCDISFVIIMSAGMIVALVLATKIVRDAWKEMA